MNENLKSTEFLFAKMKKLYPTFVRPDEIDVLAWTDILAGYSQTDILDALKEYRKNVAYNVAPLPAKFKEYLHKNDTTTAPVEEKHYLPTPSSLMQADIDSGDCRNNLYVYDAAFRLVTQDWLAEILPVDVYARTGYPQNVQLALNNGLFNRFGEALRMVAKKKFGRDYEFLSANDKAAQKGTSGTVERFNPVKTLAAHWGV